MAHNAGRHSQTWCRTRFTHGLCSGYRFDNSTTLASIGIAFPAHQGQIEILCSCSCHSEGVLIAEDLSRYEQAHYWTEQLFGEVIGYGAVILAAAKEMSSIENYPETASLDPSDAEDYYIRGNEDYHFGEYENALQNYDEAIRLDPNHSPAYFGRGAAYMRLGEYEKAIENYTEAIRLDPSYANSYFNRGWIYHELGKHGKAIENFNEVIRLNPNNAEAYVNRGVAYSWMGEYEKALQNYDEAIRLDPGYELAIENRKLTLAKMNR